MTKTTTTTDKRVRKAPGSGGNKGAAILAWFEANPEGATVKDVAAACECTPARVYEVIRATPAIMRNASGIVALLNETKPARKRAPKKEVAK